VGLTGTPFLVVCLVLAVAAPVAALVLWQRVRGPGALRVTQRLAMILVCQVTGLAVTGAAVNDYFFFYSSWNDLLGTGGTTYEASVTSGDALPNTAVTEARTIAQARIGSPDAQQHGLVLSQTLVGARTHLSAPAFIYLPPQYFQPQYARVRFPVSLVMPGYPGAPQLYLTHLPVQTVMKREIAAGRARTPFIAVLIPETVVPPRDTECSDVSHGPQVETFLARDVRDDVIRALRARTDAAGWSTLGDSTGGYCAVKLVVDHPTLFHTGVGLSPYYRPILDVTTGSLYGGSRRLFDLNSPAWLVAHGHVPPVDLMVTSSKQEHTYWQTRDFIRSARAPMQVTPLITATGGHNTNAWSRLLPAAVDYLCNHLPPL
jgi:enterochelin esterase-like enzyme